MRSITTLTLILALGLTACTTDKDDTATDTAATSNVSVGDTTTGGGTTAEPTTTTTTTTPTTTGATESGTTGATTEAPGTTTGEPGTTTTGEPGTTTGGSTGGTTGGANDESPYNACASNMDCAPGAFCINAAVTMDAVKGNFCSPACDGDMCPDPAGGVNAGGGAQCIFGADPMMPTNCAVICVFGKDDCGPDSDCEDIGIPMQMGMTFGVCSHPA